ncbi:hypothetical protein F2Q70_00029127 [Brassica cretica]|uniref:Uncharacterized protein n=1 Tax=Brassica cretica TaxID=69181 RepID=A0A8S9FQ22_BRACR|nr:hypothetical protein F2Q70_00029127 [Brassica cretica]
MSSSTRSNNETQLLFSPDPASLERSIRKEARYSSIDNTTCSSIDFCQPPSTQTLVPSTDTRSPLLTEDTHLPSTDIFHPTSIDTSIQTSIDTGPRDMVATLILVRDDRGNLHDQEGHLRNAAGQRIYAQGAAIPEYMPSSTRSNKETQLLFSPDPASLELPSTDTRSPLSTEDTHLPSTDIFHPTSIDTLIRTSIDTEQPDMVATLILVRDDRGNLHDQEGHLRNASVVKEEKLQEGDFEVESQMSFGGSHWCQSTPNHKHRSTDVIQNRSTSSPGHRSTTPTESTAYCKSVRIMTHEDFAAKHPHLPCPVYMPKIDVARLNALKPKPKPSEHPPKTVGTPPGDGVDPMEVE